MMRTPEQVKGRIKKISKENHADARLLLRLYMMERFLERVSISEYRNNFILKGGLLITALVGISNRSTMDIDSTIKTFDLSLDVAMKMIKEICSIDLQDGVMFVVKNETSIMDEMDYPGIRFHLDAIMEKMITPLKIDMSTGDIITPEAIEFQYKLMLDDRNINILTYNLETILAEKIQTILSRGTLNTRMRDFYDIKMLLETNKQNINPSILSQAFFETCKKRHTENLKFKWKSILQTVENSEQLEYLWQKYQSKYSYASHICFQETVQSLKSLLEKIDSTKI